jgi:hypothetical protein
MSFRLTVGWRLMEGPIVAQKVLWRSFYISQSSRRSSIILANLVRNTQMTISAHSPEFHRISSNWSKTAETRI